MALQLDELALDDEDLMHIRDAASHLTAEGNLSLQTLAGVLHDLNMYGIGHDLRWGSTIELIEEEINL